MKSPLDDAAVGRMLRAQGCRILKAWAALGSLCRSGAWINTSSPCMCCFQCQLCKPVGLAGAPYQSGVLGLTGL